MHMHTHTLTDLSKSKSTHCHTLSAGETHTNTHTHTSFGFWAALSIPMWAVNRCTHVSWEAYFFSCLFMNLPLTSSVWLQTIMSVCKCSPLVNQAWDELCFRVNWVREQREKLKWRAASIFNTPEINLFVFSSDNTEQKMNLTWEMLKTINYARTNHQSPCLPRTMVLFTATKHMSEAKELFKCCGKYCYWYILEWSWSRRWLTGRSWVCSVSEPWRVSGETGIKQGTLLHCNNNHFCLFLFYGKTDSRTFTVT